MPAEPQPSLTISSLDLVRLERLLESPAYRDLDIAKRLGDELVRANVVAPADMPADVVSMNSRVTCVEEISGRAPPDAGLSARRRRGRRRVSCSRRSARHCW